MLGILNKARNLPKSNDKKRNIDLFGLALPRRYSSFAIHDLAARTQGSIFRISLNLRNAQLAAKMKSRFPFTPVLCGRGSFLPNGSRWGFLF
jgi:hypothetical protein